MYSHFDIADVILIRSLEDPGGRPVTETAEAAARWKGAAAAVGAGTCTARRGSPSATRPPPQRRTIESPSRLKSEMVTQVCNYSKLWAIHNVQSLTQVSTFSLVHSLEWHYRLPLPP